MICLDANFIIELMLERARVSDCERYLSDATDDLAITTLSVSTVMYYAEGKHLNLASVELFLRQFNWLTASEIDVNWAFANYQGKDFEDALQIAIAKRESCNRFATLDKQLAKKYSADLPIDLLH